MNGRNLVIGDLGHVKVLESSPNSNSSSTMSFGTNSYLAPEAYDSSKRSSKLDIWSCGCIDYELVDLDKLFNSRNLDKLRETILSFNIEKQNIEKINAKAPLHAKILKK